MVLPRPVPDSYLGMTASSYAGLLRQADSPEYVLPIGVLGEGTPLGFGLARLSPGSPAGDVLSLFVEPAYQSHGIGTKLLETLEGGLSAVGCTRALLGYFSPAPSVPALERILQKRDWLAPEVRMVSLEIDSTIIRRSRWARNISLPAGFEFFSWGELRPEERATLDKLRETVPAPLWPFAHPAEPDPPTSVGLRHDGAVVGWMITHRTGPARVAFTSLFVREPWRNSFLNAAVLAEALRRAVIQYGEAFLGLVEVQIENAPMFRLLQRKLLPHATRVLELRRAEKRLV